MPTLLEIRPHHSEPSWREKALGAAYAEAHEGTSGAQPGDIFFLSRLLEQKLPGFIERVGEEHVATVDLAIPDILADAARLASDVLPSLNAVPVGSVEALGDALTDLREVLLHTKGQVDAAEKALSKLVDACVAPTA